MTAPAAGPAPLVRSFSMFSRAKEAGPSSTVAPETLDLRYEMLRTLTLPSPLTSGTPFSFGSASVVCGTPLPSRPQAPPARSDTLPDDWRLLSTLHFFSSEPFTALGSSAAAADFPAALSSFAGRAAAITTTSAAGSGAGAAAAAATASPSARFRRALLYWCYPDAPLPTAITILRAGSEGVSAFHAARVASWMLALRSAVDMLCAGKASSFYIQFPDNLALFRVVQGQLEVLLAKSSPGLRRQLQACDVPFQRPLCTETVADVLEPDDDVLITALSKQPAALEDTSLLRMTGRWAMQGFAQHLMDAVDATRTAFNWIGQDVPQILSGSPFLGGCMKQATIVLNGRVATGNTESSQVAQSRPQYLMKIVGPLLPSMARGMCEALLIDHMSSTDPSEEAFTCKLDPARLARLFNVGTAGGGEATPAVLELKCFPGDLDTPWAVTHV